MKIDSNLFDKEKHEISMTMRRALIDHLIAWFESLWQSNKFPPKSLFLVCSTEITSFFVR